MWTIAACAGTRTMTVLARHVDGVESSPSTCSTRGGRVNIQEVITDPGADL